MKEKQSNKKMREKKRAREGEEQGEPWEKKIK